MVAAEEAQPLPLHAETLGLDDRFVLLGLGVLERASSFEQRIDRDFVQPNFAVCVLREWARQKNFPERFKILATQSVLKQFSVGISPVPDVVLTGEAHGYWFLNFPADKMLLLWPVNYSCPGISVFLLREPLPGQPAGRHAIDPVALDRRWVLVDGALVMVDPDQVRVLHQALHAQIEDVELRFLRHRRHRVAVLPSDQFSLR